MQKNIGVVSLLFATLIVAGCAGQFKSSTPEETVGRLAQERLDALLAKDLEKAYEFTSPAYRSSVSLARYKPHVAGAAGWKSGKIDSVSCEEQLCDVRYIVTYRTAFIKTDLTTQINERWINIDGNWWLYQK
ncbi:hypothetical protein QWI17_05225 [Gilvimarinus sp. SDUM040013]|uniref:Lipoprotein n=1 Tax=Gilvimarinus gilvus TaxID=3058038 RepID=A0ABU4RYH4_9GAMM|nr:hypothetical protein [Gilvimarinus sp. SDUM040013]MDO3385238.1 hypothetical protein [Gilvimarinus sp. SDUM040013]MDX6849221.1 hypothetical protein [Gilvimarinus sp. SDUM040013]